MIATTLVALALMMTGPVHPAPPVADAITLVRMALQAVKTGRIDEARRAYLEAARLEPSVRDWLILRALELTPDAVDRTERFAQIRIAPARERITLTDAIARERGRDYVGAAASYERAGRPVDAIRVGLRVPGADRSAQRRRLDLLVHGDVMPIAASAASLLLSTYAPLTPEEALGVARAASATNQHARAAAQYRVGLVSHGATGGDSIALGRALSRSNRGVEAIGTLDRIAGTSPSRATAELEMARIELRTGSKPAARTRLRLLTERYPTADATADALLLLGDLAWDDEDVTGARDAYVAIGRRFPASEQAPRARFLGALAAWRLKQRATAAKEWRDLRAELNTGEIAAAAEYWQGRALAEMDNEAGARVVWVALRARDSMSYYAVAAAERLGVPAWTMSGAPDQFISYPAIDSSATRIRTLERIGLVAEVGFERDWLVRSADSFERKLSTARALHAAGQSMAAIRIARSTLATTPPDLRTYRLIYPFPLEAGIRAMAAEATVDPWLVAALTRQESAWEARATSRVGARGLMQVMPSTGALVARKLSIRGWHADSLYQPTINLRIGIRYLAETLGRCQGDHVCALAGYNAGPGRIARWMARPGGDDRDFLIERMGFAETRDYVRTVTRNLALYRALYGASPPVP